MFGNFWLKAPVTGNHKFLISADDNFELWFNSVAGDASIDYNDDTNRIAHLGSHTDFRRFYQNFDNANVKQESDAISLT